MSMNFPFICSPTDPNFAVPDKVLLQIGNALAENDSILVVAATNSRRAQEYNGYLSSLAQHKDIKDRLLIVINGEISEKDEPVKIFFPAQQKPYSVILNESSNFPGGLPWQECTVTAIGTNIHYEEKCFGTGTSFSAPLVTSLCALKREKNPELNGVEIVKSIKENCLKANVENFNALFGHGFINAAATLGLNN